MPQGAVPLELEIPSDVGYIEAAVAQVVRRCEAAAFPGKGHQSAEDEELRRLRRQLAEVTEERDILKKALGVFSRRPK